MKDVERRRHTSLLDEACQRLNRLFPRLLVLRNAGTHSNTMLHRFENYVGSRSIGILRVQDALRESIIPAEGRLPRSVN